MRVNVEDRLACYSIGDEEFYEGLFERLGETCFVALCDIFERFCRWMGCALGERDW